MVLSAPLGRDGDESADGTRCTGGAAAHGGAAALPGAGGAERPLTTWPGRRLCGSAPTSPRSPWRPRGRSARDARSSPPAPAPGSSPRAGSGPYVGAEGQQAVGALRVVGDLHQRVEGQLRLHEVLGEVGRAEDAAAAAAAGHVARQDDLGGGTRGAQPQARGRSPGTAPRASEARARGCRGARLAAPSAHLPRIVGSDGHAELGADEGVVDEVGDVLEGLPVVLAARGSAAAP